MALTGRIRGLGLRDGKSIGEISRLTSLSRNTIKQWLQTTPGSRPEYRSPDVSIKRTPFVWTLTQALEVDASRAKRGRRTARALDIQLAAKATPAATRD